MPILGAFIYLKFRKKFLAPIIVFSIKFFSFFLPTAGFYNEIVDGKFMYLFNSTIGAVQLSCIFALFTFVGVIIGILIEKIFLKNGGEKDESKKKKIIFSVILIILVFGVLFIYNIFNGNPISKAIERKKLQSYIEKTYLGTDFKILKKSLDKWNFI